MVDRPHLIEELVNSHFHQYPPKGFVAYIHWFDKNPTTAGPAPVVSDRYKGIAQNLYLKMILPAIYAAEQLVAEEAEAPSNQTGQSPIYVRKGPPQ